MLTEIHLLNFKSFPDTRIAVAPMTLLAGLNNSGKSSVLQSLRMLWRWIETGDPSLPNHGSLKEMKNVNASRSDPIRIAFRFGDQLKRTLQIDFDAHGKLSIRPATGSFPPLPSMSYVAADRWGPRVSLPIYTALGDLTHVGEYGEYVLDFLSRHEIDIVPPTLRHPEAEGETLEYNVRAWLKEISPNVDFKHTRDPQRDTSYATIDGFRPPNTGFGLSYTLPVIVSLLCMSAEWKDAGEQEFSSKHSSLVLLENPEAHLHPKGQTEMGRLIACSAASGVQVIVETHSDHIMDGVRIAVKEGLIQSSETLFHYFTGNSPYESTIVTPKLHSDGKLDYWPEGFFDQTLKNRARLSRRK